MTTFCESSCELRFKEFQVIFTVKHCMWRLVVALCLFSVECVTSEKKTQLIVPGTF